MNQIKNKIQIRELINFLNYHTKLYDEGNPIISDQEWDKAYFELQELEKEHSIYYNDSPTQHIHYETMNSLEKVAHNHDMLSLEKTKSLEEVKDFLGNVPCLAMCKMDGLTCSLKYVNGELVSAETRGDGKIGENILHNAKVINSIPHKIPLDETIVIDGEIICSKEDFESFESEYKNPRNFASGSIRLLSSLKCSKRKLQFVAWDVIEGLDDEKFLSSKLNILSACGFTVVPFIIGNRPSVSEWYYNELVEEIKLMANENTYPIDGIVFKFDDVEYGKSLGKTAHHFKNAIAFKFADETEISYLKEIDWTMGRTGQLTPVAVFEPVEMDGSTVERASLHNLSIMEDVLGKPYIGQEVEIFKANMIIPQILRSEKRETGNFIGIPIFCPICGDKTAIKKDNETKFLICTNSNCEGKLINRLDHFVGKKGLDIKGLSKATLEKLIDWGWVSSYKDLFELKQYRAEWVKKSGFGVKSVDKVLDAIETARACELASFISSLGIPLVGSTVSKEIVKKFSTWENFINAVETGYHFWELDGFGAEMHNAIHKFDYSEAKELYDNYIIIQLSENNTTANDLNGLNFVITGKLSQFKNRDELKSVIESKGGKVVGSISGKTNYLINNDVESTSSKNVSAKKLGIPIISEEEFISTFGII